MQNVIIGGTLFRFFIVGIENIVKIKKIASSLVEAYVARLVFTNEMRVFFFISTLFFHSDDEKP